MAGRGPIEKGLGIGQLKAEKRGANIAIINEVDRVTAEERLEFINSRIRRISNAIEQYNYALQQFQAEKDAIELVIKQQQTEQQPTV